jgi:hypothetical protein
MAEIEKVNLENDKLVLYEVKKDITYGAVKLAEGEFVELLMRRYYGISILEVYAAWDGGYLTTIPFDFFEKLSLGGSLKWADQKRQPDVKP